MGLDYVECVIALEETFGVQLSDREMQRIHTVGDLHCYIEARRNPSESHGDAPDTWAMLVSLLDDQLGVPAEAINKDTKFEDLPG